MLKIKKIMKRFFGILICALAFAACDDGDLVVDTISFDEVATTTCGDANNLLFKLKESEALILNIPKKNFKEEAAVVKLPINEQNQVVYNFYDSKVTANSICDLIPPASPNVKNQWNAESGVIEITTVVVKKVDETNNSTSITGYKHNIIFKNITFGKGDGTTQFYESLGFGDYLKNITPLALAFKQDLRFCASAGTVYETSSAEALILTIDPLLIVNEDTPKDKPRTGVIGSVKNKLVYNLYSSVVPIDTFCGATDLLVKEEWLGVEGGTIEVTTTSIGNAFTHTIVFKNVTLARKNNSFRLGDVYKFGNLQTVKQ